MFLAVRDLFGVRQVEQADARRRVFGRDRFMAKIQTKAVGAGLADDARQHERAMKEIEVGEFRAITEVPQDASAGATFHGLVFCVNGECGSAAGYDSRHR